MSRLLLTLAVLVIVHNVATHRRCPHSKHHPRLSAEHNPGHHYGRCHRHHNREEDKISEIGRKYAEADDILQNFCHNNIIVPKITYSRTSYVIIYNLPETKDLKVTVTIQNQVLTTNVTGTKAFKGFSDARVMPDILKLSDAEWTFQDTDLKILIPYKVPLGIGFVAECAPENLPNSPAPVIHLHSSQE